MPGNERLSARKEVAEKSAYRPEKSPTCRPYRIHRHVPGCPGIGVKTAAQTDRQYRDLEPCWRGLSRSSRRSVGILDRVRRAGPHVEAPRAARRPGGIEMSVEDLPARWRDPKTLIAFLKAMEFTNLTKRVGEAMGIDPNAIDPDPALRADRAEATTAEPAPAPAVDEVAPAAAATTSARQLSLPYRRSRPTRKRAASLRPEATTPLGLVRHVSRNFRPEDRSRRLSNHPRRADALGQWLAHARIGGWLRSISSHIS